MTHDRSIQISKFLTRHLRHTPEAIGLVLEPGGWVVVTQLLAAAAAHGMPISREELEDVIATSDKQRFALDATGSKIRANQGHSVPVDLQLLPQIPPPILYHGTNTRSIVVILEQGLLKMRRHHVHLSSDVETAYRVGKRHGSPVVLRVDAASMCQAGYLFYCSDNGVWLTDRVPPTFLTIAEE